MSDLEASLRWRELGLKGTGLGTDVVEDSPGKPETPHKRGDGGRGISNHLTYEDMCR
jgi:hypothetical protein